MALGTWEGSLSASLNHPRMSGNKMPNGSVLCLLLMTNYLQPADLQVLVGC